ncbi:glycerol acyltransferase [Bacteroidia bacterium]|nr:glycerol acyltransferase [Bacteroidia bacterium]
MNRFFISTYTYFLSHKKLLIGLLALLTIGLTLSLLRLDYKEDISEFLPDNEANEQINAVYQHIGNSNKLLVNFSMHDLTKHDAERIMEAIDQFVVLLNERDSLHIIPEIISQVDESQFLGLTEFIQQNVPYFLTEADYVRMDTLLSNEYIAEQLNEDKRLLMLPSGGLMKQNMLSDPLHLFSPLLLKLKDFQAGDNEEVNEGYIFSHNGKKGLVILTSPYGMSETAGNADLVKMIEQTAQQTTRRFPELQITCFGASAIAVTNAEQIKKDSVLSITLAVVLILVLLIYFFRSGRNLLLVFFSVLFGWLFALGLLAVFTDSISAIAIGISSIFVGIAINYPLHFIDHLQHQKNRKQALKEIIPPLLIGNITTVGAFLGLVFLNSSAMRDLGLFGSLLLVGTILFVLVFLPHLIKRDIRDFRDLGYPKIPKKLPFERLANFAPERKPWIMGTVLVLTCVFFYLSQFTTFESDMNKINYMTDQQREDMNDMLQSIEKKDKEIVYFISEGKTMNDALSVYEQNTPLLDSLRQKRLIESIAGIGDFLPSQEEQQKRINRWNDFWKQRREAILQQIDQASAKVGFKQGSFDNFSQLLYTEFTPHVESYFSPITSLLEESYLIKGENKNRIISLLYCEKENTEQLEEVLRRCASPDNTFIFDSRSIGERVIDFLSDDFNFVLYLCGFIVFIFLTFSFGRLELSILSFLPLTISWVWILGIMQLGDMRFNIVSIILATFIFGQGDDYTIFITEGLMYEYTYRRKMLASYKNSIILSALIMFIGIGTLIFAKHPAMRSLAEVTIIGMFSVVMMAYIIPPSIFRWLTTTKQGFRDVPITIKRWGFSVYAFIVFLTGSLIITVSGFFLNKSRYHVLLCWVANWVIRHIPGVKFKYENLSGETFAQPAIIISNHQAHLDLMCLMMLTPKLIILTNDWVWNNPFYGRLIKYADFYPVSNGIENSVERLSSAVQRGYSIVVFPEGTRSEDCSILRFHRGAFYLAEKLNLDIVPVFIHGVGHVLPKKDFMLREGAITVQVHPRITLDDSRFASDYATRAKQVRQYYRNTFAALSQKIETAAYFKSFVLHNYLYKGVEIERGAREELEKLEELKKLEWIDNYQGEWPVLIENNGYGVFSFLFALVHKNIQVIATDPDEDKVAIARGCAGIPKNLTIKVNNEQLIMNNEQFQKIPQG